jgi:hypothetical protein
MLKLALFPLWSLLASVPVSSLPSQKRSAFLQRSNGTKKRVGADVYYIAESLDKIKFATSMQQVNAELRYQRENQRLDAAIDAAASPPDRALIQTEIQHTEETKMEELNAFQNMYAMYYTLKALFGAKSGAPNCNLLRCGEHAQCVMKSERATCACKPCFAGNGFICKPSACSPTGTATAQPMFLHLDTKPPKMEEVQVTVFSHGLQARMAIAYRDTRQSNRGFLMIGSAGESEIKWGVPQAFSMDLAAYQPQLVVTPTNRIVVSFRDDAKDGVGYLVGGRIDEASPYEAVMLNAFAYETKLFEASPLVQLAESRVACLYANRKTGKQAAYGGVAFLQSLKGGTVTVLGKYRFADQAVSHISVVAMRPTSFVVGYRDPPIPGEAPDTNSRELSLVWVGMQDGELIRDPHPIIVDPKTKDIGARDLALVSENLIAYSYQSKSQRTTKVAIIHVDPNNHRMKVVSSPKVISDGSTAFVKGISLPFMSLSPRTLTYIQIPGKPSVAESCTISIKGEITGCQELAWANTAVDTVSGVRLGDGRLVFVYADAAEGAPYYQMMASPG